MAVPCEYSGTHSRYGYSLFLWILVDSLGFSYADTHCRDVMRTFVDTMAILGDLQISYTELIAENPFLVKSINSIVVN